MMKQNNLKKKLACRNGMLYFSFQSHADCRMISSGMAHAMQYPAHRRTMIFPGRLHIEHLTDHSDWSGHAAVTDP
jgi:hypothetical protein